MRTLKGRSSLIDWVAAEVGVLPAVVLPAVESVPVVEVVLWFVAVLACCPCAGPKSVFSMETTVLELVLALSRVISRDTSV